jgi:hypothetical protein
MSWLTPEQEAAHALESGIARSDLSEKAKLAYDRLARHDHATAQPGPAASTDHKPPQDESATGSATSSPPAPAASTGDGSSQADSATGSAASSPPVPAASTGDKLVEIDNLGSAEGFPPGPELGTVNDNQLWGADFGVLN